MATTSYYDVASGEGLIVDSTWVTQLRKGCAEYILLVCLRDGEAYGYEILQSLSQFHPLSIGESTLYPLLGRLTREGFLSQRVMNSTSGPPRRYYRLTREGRDRLEQMDVYWKRLVGSVDELKKGSRRHE